MDPQLEGMKYEEFDFEKVKHQLNVPEKILYGFAAVVGIGGLPIALFLYFYMLIKHG